MNLTINTDGPKMVVDTNAPAWCPGIGPVAEIRPGLDGMGDALNAMVPYMKELRRVGDGEAEMWLEDLGDALRRTCAVQFCDMASDLVNDGVWLIDKALPRNTRFGFEGKWIGFWCTITK